MKEMKLYKKILILLIPILFWILYALFEYLYCETKILNFLDEVSLYIPFVRYMFCLLIIPITYAILTWNLSKNIKQAVLFYIISYAAQVLGFFLEGLSYIYFISGDSVTYILVYGVTEWLAILLGIAYIIAIACYILVKLVDKIPEH